jgi:hypothetical protein
MKMANNEPFAGGRNHGLQCLRSQNPSVINRRIAENNLGTDILYASKISRKVVGRKNDFIVTTKL